jgi:hypothetical protein
MSEKSSTPIIYNLKKFGCVIINILGRFKKDVLMCKIFFKRTSVITTPFLKLSQNVK